MSFDGQIVVFEGNKGNGSGIFAAYFSEGKEQIVRIAGTGLDNFVAFDPTQAVQVGGGSIGPDDRGVTIAFVGTNQSEGTGLYTARLSFFGATPDTYNPAAVVSTLVSGIEPVALDLDTLPDGKTIDQVSFGFGIDEVDRGQLAFWVQTVDGTQEIIQAEPNQVVWINFNPADSAQLGLAQSNLDLLAQVGITDLGLTSSMAATLTSLGLQTDKSALETAIVNYVQQLYTSTGRTCSFSEAIRPPPAWNIFRSPSSTVPETP